MYLLRLSSVLHVDTPAMPVAVKLVLQCLRQLEDTPPIFRQ